MIYFIVHQNPIVYYGQIVYTLMHFYGHWSEFQPRPICIVLICVYYEGSDHICIV